MLKARVVSVKFDYLKQVYLYDPKNLWVYKNLPVLVKKDNYLEYGIIIKVDKANKSKALPPIIKTVRDIDIKKYNENKQFESYALKICKKKIKELDLNMKLIKAHITFDRYKIIFLYTSGERINFKLIVRELVHFFKMKVEFKYVGVRNEAANIKSIGICGRPLCCNKFLTHFEDISLNQAKEQGVSLYPVKVSGNCGRLLCCLKYEQDMYDKLKLSAPKLGTTVQTPDGVGMVFKVNLLTQSAKVSFAQENKKGDLFGIYKISDLKVL